MGAGAPRSTVAVAADIWGRLLRIIRSRRGRCPSSRPGRPEAVRCAIQHSLESLRTLAKRYGINQKTVAKWSKRTSVADL